MGGHARTHARTHARMTHLGVVRNDDDAAVEVRDRIRQRIDRLHVEVVGGFVQQEDVRVGEGHSGKHDARLLAAAKLDDGLQVVVTAQTELAQHRTHLFDAITLVWELLHQILKRRGISVCMGVWVGGCGMCGMCGEGGDDGLGWVRWVCPMQINMKEGGRREANA